MRMEAVAPGRSHVQQTLKQALREARHRVKEELREAAATPQQRREFREMTHEFRDGLREAFLDAGRGSAFSRALVVEGAGTAMASFTERLRAYLGEPAEQPAAPEEPAATDPEAVPEGEGTGTTGHADGAAPASADPILDVLA